MSIFSFLDEEQSFFLILKWEPRGVLTSLAFILNLSRTCSIYFSCDNYSLLTFLSQRICIPKICLAGPKSFISNDLNKSFFKFPITSTSFSIVNISSTYSRRITNLPLGNFLTYTQWSAFVLVYPWPIINESNILYHHLGACLKPYKLFFNLYHIG